MLPETGGFYAYLREGWGRPVAFLFGWSELVLIRANALGGMSIVFGEYGLRTFGIDPAVHPLRARGLAAAAIGCAAFANIRGARIGAAIVGWSTAAKFLALTMLVGCVARAWRGARRGCFSLSPPRQQGPRQLRPAASGLRSSASSGLTTASRTCRSPAAR